MKVSLKWLADYVDVPADIKEFCDRLDLTGTGVEGVERTGDNFDGVVVGHVLTCDEHPDSDHMHVVTVDVGAGEPIQIVCGAPNVAAGQKVIVARYRWQPLAPCYRATSKSKSPSFAAWPPTECAAPSAN